MFVFILLIFLKCVLSIKYDVPYGCEYNITKNDEVLLNCTLTSINSENEKTNFTLIPSDYTTFLFINCNTKILSNLHDNDFQHLINLRQFSLINCKLNKWNTNVLYGLNKLRKLIINTYNEHDIKLEFLSNSFNSNTLLEYLDLSYNNLYTFPEYLFCKLTNLVQLNLSRNNLQDISDLKFQINKIDDNMTEIIETMNCNLDIQILDVSYNSFGHIPPNTLTSLRRLNDLKLNNNGLISLADKALYGLKSLKILNLSNNNIIALPSGLFNECKELQEIHLQNNSLVAMAPNTFTGLTHLLALDLSKNKLTSSWLNSKTFSGLIRLVLLNLSNNAFTKLYNDYFQDLYTLQILNLEHNLIEILNNETFSPMRNLHTLILSYNKLKTIESTSFIGLFALSQLALDNNILIGLHSESFRNCTALQDLTLNGNLLNIIPNALADMRLLKSLDLGENNIEEIDGFRGMTNLQGLRLVNNNLIKLNKKSFSEMPSLQILNIANNKIKIIEEDTFLININLQAIRLDSNQIKDIGTLFIHLNKLQWLNISDNDIDTFHYKQIPSSLEWLDLHKNNIENISATNDNNIKSLDISFNKLTQINENSFPSTVELLFLNDNQIKNVSVNTFLNKPNLKRVDLYANQIINMELNSLQITSNNNKLPEFYIGGNPYQCDCTMEWLQRINDLELKQHPRVMDLDSIYCRLPYNRHQRFISLLEADSSHFVCKYQTHCFALCHCCEFDACDCKMKCPSNCTCYHDQSWSAANIVDCSLSHHLNLPTNIPMDATIVYLDGNSFYNLDSHLFIGRKNLHTLYLNNSKIDTINNHTFTGLKRLEKLHLENNRITELFGFEFIQLDELRELYLQKNRINIISNNTFNNLKNLQVLRLDGNMLNLYPVWTLNEQLPYLVRLTLSDNNWSCNCQYIREFRSWLRVNIAKVSDSNNIACVIRIQPTVDGSISKKLGSYMSDNNSTTSCSSYLIGNYTEFDTQLKLPLIFISIFIIILIIICFICIIIVNKRKKSSLSYNWLNLCNGKKTSTISTIEMYNESFIYDAFIMYSIKDEDFITHVLLKNLETQYKLCLQYRENPNYLFETIEKSNKLIIILSPHFIITEWRRAEIRSAIKDIIQRDYNKNKLIIINLTSVSTKDLDIDLRLFIKKCIYITWKDKKFWKKLKSALPIASLLTSSNKMFSINTSTTNNTTNSTNTNNRELFNYKKEQPTRLLPRSLESHLQNELWD